jgi:hypothetical protein
LVAAYRFGSGNHALDVFQDAGCGGKFGMVGEDVAMHGPIISAFAPVDINATKPGTNISFSRYPLGLYKFCGNNKGKQKTNRINWNRPNALCPL